MGGGEVHVEVRNPWLEQNLNESPFDNGCDMIPLRVDMPSRVSVRPLLTGHRSGEDGPLWEEILCALKNKALSYIHIYVWMRFNINSCLERCM